MLSEAEALLTWLNRKTGRIARRDVVAAMNEGETSPEVLAFFDFCYVHLPTTALPQQVPAHTLIGEVMSRDRLEARRLANFLRTRVDVSWLDISQVYTLLDERERMPFVRECFLRAQYAVFRPDPWIAVIDVVHGAVAKIIEQGLDNPPPTVVS